MATQTPRVLGTAIQFKLSYSNESAANMSSAMRHISNRGSICFGPLAPPLTAICGLRTCANPSISRSLRCISPLVTGGTGFVGSHTVVELINAGQDVVIVDDLSNSSEKVIGRIRKITGLYASNTTWKSLF